MLIFYKSLDLEEGFKISELHKNSRIVAGREVSNASGIELYRSLRGTPIKCWKCGCVADQWISCRDQNDEKSRPVLNLFATKKLPVNKKHPYVRMITVLMTRDHIIPKSLGGTDSILNLRPACSTCNMHRGNKLTKADQKFMLAHPELICPERLAKGQKGAKREASNKEQAELRKAQWGLQQEQ